MCKFLLFGFLFSTHLFANRGSPTLKIVKLIVAIKAMSVESL